MVPKVVVDCHLTPFHWPRNQCPFPSRGDTVSTPRSKGGKYDVGHGRPVRPCLYTDYVFNLLPPRGGNAAEGRQTPLVVSVRTTKFTTSRKTGKPVAAGQWEE